MPNQGFGRKTPIKPSTKDELDAVPAQKGYGTKATQDAKPIPRRNSSGSYTTGKS